MNYCECDYDDPPEFYSEEVRRARKEHRCYECSGPIRPGETYLNRAGKWDGRVSSYPECHLCMEVREWAKISMECFCSNVLGELHSDCTEMMLDVGHTVPGWRMEYGRRVIRIIRNGGTGLQTFLMRHRSELRNREGVVVH